MWSLPLNKRQNVTTQTNSIRQIQSAVFNFSTPLAGIVNKIASVNYSCNKIIVVNISDICLHAMFKLLLWLIFMTVSCGHNLRIGIGLCYNTFFIVINAISLNVCNWIGKVIVHRELVLPWNSTLKNANNCLNTNIYSYLETSGCKC